MNENSIYTQWFQLIDLERYHLHQVSHLHKHTSGPRGQAPAEPMEYGTMYHSWSSSSKGGLVDVKRQPRSLEVATHGVRRRSHLCQKNLEVPRFIELLMTRPVMRGFLKGLFWQFRTFLKIVFVMTHVRNDFHIRPRGVSTVWTSSAPELGSPHASPGNRSGHSYLSQK